MVKVRPFKAFLANKKIASKVICPPYDVISSEEARVLASGNQCSFLHVKKPEIDLPPETDYYSDIVYQTGRKNLLKFIKEGWI